MAATKEHRAWMASLTFAVPICAPFTWQSDGVPSIPYFHAPLAGLADVALEAQRDWDWLK